MKHIFSFILFFIFLTSIYCQITITGTIEDSHKEPLIGVSIIELGTTNGVVSDYDGNYSIMVKDSSSDLEFSFIGYERQVIRVNKHRKINIVLKIDSIKSKEYEIIRVGKPAIYLYPEETKEVSVKVSTGCQILTTYPEYNQGWNVTAYPNGKLINKKDGLEYFYLFWDGKMALSDEYVTYNEGFVINGDSTLTFLQKSLTKLGLSPMEMNDFIVFWLPKMKFNKYNFIYFRTGKEYEAISTNSVTPKPDTECRIFMDFKPIKYFIDMNPQILTSVPRKGFTLVEWGGSEINQIIKVKTSGVTVEVR